MVLEKTDTQLIEFFLIVRFERGYQPSIFELEDKLLEYLSELNFNPSKSIIKIKNFEYSISYWMYEQDMEDYIELEEEDIFVRNVVDDITICLIPKMSDEQVREILLRAKEVLEELGEKIQQNFNVKSWNVKLNIESRDASTIKKLVDRIEEELEMISARYNSEENIDGEVILSVWDVDAAFIEALSRVLLNR